MKCSNCGFENGDQAKFCAECGTRLAAAQDSDDVLASGQDQTAVGEPEEADTGILRPEMLEQDNEQIDPALDSASQQDVWQDDDSEYETQILSTDSSEVQPVLDEEDWYYVKAGKSVGPFRRSVFEGMIASGEIQPKTYIWTKGMNEWTRLDATVLKDLIPTEQDTVIVSEENPQASQEIVLDTNKNDLDAADNASDEMDAAEELMAKTNAVEEKINTDDAASSNGSASYSTPLPQWYYVKNNQTYGPYEQQTMIENLASGIIGPNTYVWKDGMADWAYVKNTDLAAWMHTAPNSFGSSQNQWNKDTGGYQNASQFTGSRNSSGVQYGPVVQPRSVILYIILSVCTCGIFQICWIYMIARDLNILAAQRGKPAGCDPTISVILTLLSCGIYQVYYFWKEGTLAASLSRNGYVTNNSGILAILGLFLPIASCAILQDQLNTLITND